jgi:hypothetical protein
MLIDSLAADSQKPRYSELIVERFEPSGDGTLSKKAEEPEQYDDTQRNSE